MTEPEREPERQAAPRTLAVAGLLVIALVGAAWFALHRPSDPSLGALSYYGSTQAMATRAGCGQTFQPALLGGGSRSAGSCTLDGLTLDFRIYGTAGESSAWLDGARGESNTAGAVGGNWAVLITGTKDVQRINTILTALQ